MYNMELYGIFVQLLFMTKRIKWEDSWSIKLTRWLEVSRSYLIEYGHISEDSLIFSHIASEGHDKLENQKKVRLWLRRGLPDFIICIPSEISSNEKTTLLFVELKEPSGLTGKTPKATAEQLLWLEALGRTEGVKSKLCIGYQEAITFFLDHLSLKAKSRLDQVGHIELIEDRLWVRKLYAELNSASES